jgi:hypothetical protein
MSRPISNYFWIIGACAMCYMPFAAQAQLKHYNKAEPARVLAQQGFDSSVRRSKPPETTAQAPTSLTPPSPPSVINVQPPNVNVAAPPPAVVNVAAPPPAVVNVTPTPVTVSPTLTVPDPTFLDQIRAWLTPILLAIATTFLGKTALFGIRQTAPGAPGAPGSMPHLDVLMKLKEKFDDPSTKNAIDGVALRVIESNLLGAGIQAGLGFVPGAGPFLAAGAARLDPMAKAAIDDYLNKRISDRGGVVEPHQPDPAAPATDRMSTSTLVDMIGGLKELIDKRLPPRS